MGTGIAQGDERAIEAAQAAISSPLLEEATIDGARGILINITGGEDMTLKEVAEASSLIHDTAHPDANIIFGTVIDRAMQGEVKVTVIATGFTREDTRELHTRGGPRSEPTAASIVRPGPIPWGEPGAEPPAQGQATGEPSVYRPGQSQGGDVPELDLSTDGFDPQFRGNLKDDLDVPAFLRKQMD